MFACMGAKLLQSCRTLCDPMDRSLPGSSFHGILQARILEWVVMPSSSGSSMLLYSSVSSVQSLGVSDSLRPHGLQHARPPCPSPTPGVYSDSSPSSWWCHPTISSSVIPFSSRLQSFPASGSFQMSHFSIASVLNTKKAAGSPWPFRIIVFTYRLTLEILQTR